MYRPNSPLAQLTQKLRELARTIWWSASDYRTVSATANAKTTAGLAEQIGQLKRSCGWLK